MKLLSFKKKSVDDEQKKREEIGRLYPTWDIAPNSSNLTIDEMARALLEYIQIVIEETGLAQSDRVTILRIKENYVLHKHEFTPAHQRIMKQVAQRAIQLLRQKSRKGNCGG